MKENKIELSGFLIVLCLPVLTWSQEPQSLGPALAKAAQYCQRLQTAVLEFSCRERIVDIFETNSGKQVSSQFRFLYKLVEDHAQVNENRFLYNRAKQTYEAAELPETIRFFSRFGVFLPIDVLSRENQAGYTFHALPPIRQGNRTILPVAVNAQDPHRLFSGGVIHIDLKDGSIPRIEVASHSLRNPLYLEEGSTVEDIHEYDVIHKNLRFPSQTVIRMKAPEQPAPFIFNRWHKTVFTYENYRFFKIIVKNELSGVEK